MRHAGDNSSPYNVRKAPRLVDMVLDELRLSPKLYFQCYQAALIHHLILEDAKRNQVANPIDKTQMLLREWLRTIGIEGASELNAWLKANHLTSSEVEQLAQERALLSQSRARLRRHAETQMPNQLRFSGDYEAVAQRALDKDRTVSLHEMENSSLHSTELTDDELLQHYLTRIPRPDTSTFEAYSSLLYFLHAQRDQAINMLRREQRYRRDSI
jgi:hypothetical protein